MSNIQIAIINESTRLLDSDVVRVVASLQIQIHEHFAPAWGVDADLTFYPERNAPPSSWQLRILDTLEQANELGVHELTDNGLPLGKVFIGSNIKSCGQWSITASHELMEMLVDPDINLTVYVEDNQGSSVLYAYESCDPCQGVSWAYSIGDILVSDFVYPSWFEGFHAYTQFDFCNHIKASFELLSEGYICVYDMERKDGWQKMDQWSISPVNGSRWQRRNTPKSHWRRSK